MYDVGCDSHIINYSIVANILLLQYRSVPCTKFCKASFAQSIVSFSICYILNIYFAIYAFRWLVIFLLSSFYCVVCITIITYVIGLDKRTKDFLKKKLELLCIMSKKVVRILRLLIELRYKYLFQFSIVIVERGSKLEVGENTKIIKSKIVVKNRHNLQIGNSCIIKNALFPFIVITVGENHQQAVMEISMVYTYKLMVVSSVVIGIFLSRKVILRCLPFLMGAQISDIIIVL